MSRTQILLVVIGLLAVIRGVFDLVIQRRYELRQGRERVGGLAGVLGVVWVSLGVVLLGAALAFSVFDIE